MEGMKHSQTDQLLQTEIQALRQQNTQLSEQLAVLTHQLDWFKRQLFGRKSEKQIIDNPFQGGLFEFVGPPEPPSAETEVKPHKRSSKKSRRDEDVNDTGLRFDDNVPKKIIEVPAPELSDENADDYEIISYKETTRLAQQPGSYTILVYRRPVVKRKDSNHITTPAAPTNVLEGTYADVSVVAGLMVDKAVYHLPLYRQHQRMLDSGIQISRATMLNWIKKGIELLKPIYQAQWKHILQSKVLAMDEVPIKAGRKSKGKMKQTYFWPMYGEEDEIAFTWSASRGHKYALEQLEGFCGTLLTDGYQAYEKAVNELNKHEINIVHANCWAHCRRKFEAALKMEPKAAQQALAYIGALYKVEEHIRESNLDSEKTLQYRRKHSIAIVDSFFTWVYEQRNRPDLLPSNPLSKALQYADDRINELKVFLANPNVSPDTNHLERALRVIPMGRKNYLFCWTEIGAEQLGMLQSLMVTCRLQGINPYTYLVDVLQRVALHPASKVEELTPRVWKTKFADNFLTSDLIG